MKWNSYFRLARFDKPVGILLLWAPTAWALWIANEGKPSLRLVFLFLLGTIFMRAAGCIINDIADRKIDLHVRRTEQRPLTSGEVSFHEAVLLLIFFLCCALIILIQLPYTCFYYALLALAVTFIYPFCKRFIAGPQLVLGIAFSFGIPMAFAASFAPFNSNVLYLLLINFAWIVAYDTQYAMVDRVDDLRIGVKSTAILFSSYDRLIIAGLQIFFHGLWLLIAVNLRFSKVFLLFWSTAGFILIYQQWLLKDRNEAKCFQAFLSNASYGLILWLGIIVSS